MDDPLEMLIVNDLIDLIATMFLGEPARISLGVQEERTPIMEARSKFHEKLNC